MKKGLLVLLILIVVLVGVGVSNYNSLIPLEEEVNSSWAQVENILKSRADLIPNLVNTVKGYADHESEVFIKVTEARSKVLEANSPEEYAEANAELDKALVDINMVVEAYPELKANQNFLNLQAELTGMENKLATERLRYNDSVQNYNSITRKFPKNIFAKLFGFEQKEYFKINEEDAKVPEVNF